MRVPWIGREALEEPVHPGGRQRVPRAALLEGLVARAIHVDQWIDQAERQRLQRSLFLQERKSRDER